MAGASYDAAAQERVGVLLHKEGIKRDAEVPAREDVICFTFLRWYFQPLADNHDPDAVLRIVAKTAQDVAG